MHDGRPDRWMIYFFWCCLLIVPSVSILGQEVPDTAFNPHIEVPAYPHGSGPVVLFDEAHNNRHALDSTYRGFAELLRKDGYQVLPLRASLSRHALADCDILVIVNALADENVDNWRIPIHSALSADEIDDVVTWVRSGGSLLLVADHMPFPAAVEELASEFELAFMNGFAIDTLQWRALHFRRADGTLIPHPITQGRNDTERVDSVVTYWGQAFTAAGDRISPLLRFRDGVVSFNPKEAWKFDDETEIIHVGGWLQGCAMPFGDGRVVILGEAAMITAQNVGPKLIPVGMNAPAARGNIQFVLNTMHWLSGLLPLELE